MPAACTLGRVPPLAPKGLRPRSLAPPPATPLLKTIQGQDRFDQDQDLKKNGLKTGLKFDENLAKKVKHTKCKRDLRCEMWHVQYASTLRSNVSINHGWFS